MKESLQALINLGRRLQIATDRSIERLKKIRSYRLKVKASAQADLLKSLNEAINQVEEFRESAAYQEGLRAFFSRPDAVMVLGDHQITFGGYVKNLKHIATDERVKKSVRYARYRRHGVSPKGAAWDQQFSPDPDRYRRFYRHVVYENRYKNGEYFEEIRQRALRTPRNIAPYWVFLEYGSKRGIPSYDGTFFIKKWHERWRYFLIDIENAALDALVNDMKRAGVRFKISRPFTPRARTAELGKVRFVSIGDVRAIVSAPRY